MCRLSLAACKARWPGRGIGGGIGHSPRCPRKVIGMPSKMQRAAIANACGCDRQRSALHSPTRRTAFANACGCIARSMVLRGRAVSVAWAHFGGADGAGQAVSAGLGGLGLRGMWPPAASWRQSRAIHWRAYSATYWRSSGVSITTWSASPTMKRVMLR